MLRLAITTAILCLCLPRIQAANLNIRWEYGSVNPNKYTVAVGDKVVLQWSGYHDVIQTTSASCDSKPLRTIAPGSVANQVQLSTAQPGTFHYLCSIPNHCDYGKMQISLTVAAPAKKPPPAINPAYPLPIPSPPYPAYPPCTVTAPDQRPGYPVLREPLVRTLSVNGVRNAATVSMTVAGPNFVIVYDFSKGGFLPVNNLTYIQYYFFQTPASSDAWKSSGKANQCDPERNNLYFFTRWNAPLAKSTLPPGSTLKFTTNVLTITQPIIADATPFWGGYVPLNSLCDKNVPGGARLASRVYTKQANAKDYTNPTTGKCNGEISPAADSLLPFSFACLCEN